MKKFLIYLSIIIFCANGIVLAKSVDKGKSKHNEKTKIEKNDKEKAAKIKNEKKLKVYEEKKAEKIETQEAKGKKVEPSEGVQNAAEKGKGKKKGLFERWFGGNKEE